MASGQAKKNVGDIQQQPAVLKGKHSPGIGKNLSHISPRRSARLTISQSKNTEYKSSPATNPFSTQAPQANSRKRERSQEQEGFDIRGPAKRLEDRLQAYALKIIGHEIDNADIKNDIKPIKYWAHQGNWPKEYFEHDSHVIPARKAVSSFPSTQSEATSHTRFTATPSDQKPREVKSMAYQKGQYHILLETKGSFMYKSELDITDASKSLCQTLLYAEQTCPEDSLFQDGLFDETCNMIKSMNEAKVIQDIARLIVPSAQALAVRGAKRLKILSESVNAGWNNCIPFIEPRPQPDYSVGFKRTAFTEDQRKKLQVFFDFTEKSYFMGTYFLYFPFLTCEVKCGAAALEIADRQNANSMTTAMRGIVEFFRLVGREKELHREILAFSLSHDDSSVRIYCHYPIINGEDITYYRHPIHIFNFTVLDGKDKWTAYKFIRNVYDIWAPMHFARICSIIDELPHGINFDVSELHPSEPSRHSQVLGNQSLTASLMGNDHDQPSLANSVTLDTSASHGTEQKGFKLRQKRRTAE